MGLFGISTKDFKKAGSAFKTAVKHPASTLNTAVAKP